MAAEDGQEENMKVSNMNFSRRMLLNATAAAGMLAMTSGPAVAADQTVQFADIGVGDPNGDWSAFTAATRNKVNVLRSATARPRFSTS